MTCGPQCPPDVLHPFPMCWVIAFKHRPGLYLGRNGTTRTIPLLFGSPSDADAAMFALPAHEHEDWLVLAVTLRVEPWKPGAAR